MLSERETEEKDEKKKEVLQAVEDFAAALPTDFKWVADGFRSIVTNPRIDEVLDSAYIETAKKHYINKHGAVHGLNVALYTLRLFELINNEIITSDYVQDFKYPLGGVLFILLVASYIHDAGRFYDVRIKQHEERVSDAIDLIDFKSMVPSELPMRFFEDIPRRIKEVCLLHDKKEEPSEKVEIALLKLADALDCSFKRVYTEHQHPEIGGDPVNQFRTVLRKDNRPEKFFGCASVVKDPELNFNSEENILEIMFTIKDYAASVPLKAVLNVLKACENGEESVRALGSRIRIKVNETEIEKQYFIYPKAIEALPGARFPKFIWNVDVLNREGDAIIESLFELKNEGDRAGIKSRVFKLWGDNPTVEEDVKLQMFELLNEVSLEPFQSCDAPRVEDAQLRSLKVEHKFTEDEGKTHTWLVFLPKTLQCGDAIRVAGVCKWKRCINLSNSEWVHSAKVPCEHLTVNIFFPKGMRQAVIKPSFEIRSEEGNVVYGAQIPYALSYSNTRKKNCIHMELGGLWVGYTYRVFWTAGL